MDTPQKNKAQKWTYAEYCTWSDGKRVELIDGVMYDFITPTPSATHQQISGALSVQFANHLRGKQCKVYTAPFDVRLPDFIGQHNKDIATVVQPDIVIICDPSKLDEPGCSGRPDLIIEITSPVTALHDMKNKFNHYERVNVKKYWIVNQTDKTTMVFKLNDSGKYGRPETYGSNDSIEVPLLGDLVIDLAEVFAE